MNDQKLLPPSTTYILGIDPYNQDDNNLSSFTIYKGSDGILSSIPIARYKRGDFNMEQLKEAINRYFYAI